ncbi:MAG: hypothetical protein FJW80_11720 [Actinobacteria bacterium]|nr:hypothetical protein [Actinomycetota bacterium]
MDEKALLSLWNQKRMHIIVAQLAPALVLIAVFVLAAQGTFASAGAPARYLAIAVAVVTGILAMTSQIATIREAEALVTDLAKVDNPTELSRRVAASKNFLVLTLAAIIGLALIILVLVVWAVLG